MRGTVYDGEELGKLQEVLHVIQGLFTSDGADAMLTRARDVRQDPPTNRRMCFIYKK